MKILQYWYHIIVILEILKVEKFLWVALTHKNSTHEKFSTVLIGNF